MIGIYKLELLFLLILNVFRADLTVPLLQVQRVIMSMLLNQNHPSAGLLGVFNSVPQLNIQLNVYREKQCL